MDLAVEGCTGWRFVVEEITAAGYVAHRAEPAGRSAHPVGARIHAECYQHGVAVPESKIRTDQTRCWLLGGTLELDTVGGTLG